MLFNKKFILFLFLIIVGSVWVYKKYEARQARIETARIAAEARAEEVTITLLPGWNIRQVAEYLVEKNVATSTKDVFALLGTPATEQKVLAIPGLELAQHEYWEGKPAAMSLEGYIAPETYRIFKNAPLEEVFEKLINQRFKELKDILATHNVAGRSVHEILTMASIVEREARGEKDRKMVADILWRRLERNWALQVDSSVHYISARTGDVFTTAEERAVDSPWNTYKYPGLPPGPIANPSIESIEATLNPEENEYWYFLTGSDGQMHYAETLDQHNTNRVKYL